MKTSIVERVLILLAFNIYQITAYIFAGSLVVAALCYFLCNQIPLPISYLFWFSLGFWGFSLAIRKASVFLEEKYEEKNGYYLNLLNKRKNESSSKLRVVYRKDKKQLD